MSQRKIAHPSEALDDTPRHSLTCQTNPSDKHAVSIAFIAVL